MENEDLKKLLEDRVEINLKRLNDALKESQERVRQYAATFGQLREETQRFADVIPKLNQSKSLITTITTYDKENIDKSLSELEKYQLKLQAIVEKKNKVLTDPNSSENDKKSAYLTAEEETQALNIATLKKTEIWTNLFSSVDKQYKSFIKARIEGIDTLLKYIKTNKAEGAIPHGFNDEEIAQINKITKGYAAGSDASIKFVKDAQTEVDGFKKTLKELESKNHFAKIIQGFKNLGGAATGSKQQVEAFSTIFEGFKGVGGAFTEVGKAMETAGVQAGKTVTTIGNVITQTVSMAGTGASVGGVWGAIIGAVAGLASSLIPALQSTDKTAQDTKHYYESLIKVTDALIDKQLELIKTSSSVTSVTAVSYAKSLLDYEKLTSKDAILAHFDSKSDKNTERHHTTQRYKKFFYDNSNMRETLGGGDSLALDTWHQDNLLTLYNRGSWEINPSKHILDLDELKKAKIDPLLFLTDVKTAVTSLTADQIRVLKEHGMGLYAELDDTTQAYLDSVVAYDDKIKEIDRIARERFTGTTFDELLKGLDNLVAKADLAGDEIGKSFEGHMSKAILNMVKKNFLSKELEKWYDDFAKAMESDDKLTEIEANALETEYNRIVDESNKKYIDAMKAAGLEIPKGADNSGQTRSATAQGIASMSQDSASELNGNFYSLFMTVDNIHKSIVSWQEQEDNKREYTLPTLQDMLTVSKSSNTYLLDIRNNTSHLIAIDENILNMNQNILALRNEGIKMRS